MEEIDFVAKSAASAIDDRIYDGNNYKVFAPACLRGHALRDHMRCGDRPRAPAEWASGKISARARQPDCARGGRACARQGLMRPKDYVAKREQVKEGEEAFRARRIKEIRERDVEAKAYEARVVRAPLAARLSRRSNIGASCAGRNH